MIKLSIKEWINLPESIAISHDVTQYTEKDWIAYEYRKDRFEISRLQLNISNTDVLDSEGVVISRTKGIFDVRSESQSRQQKRYCKECIKIFYIQSDSSMTYCSIDCLTESILRKQFKEKKRKSEIKRRREKVLTTAIDVQERKKASNTLLKELKRLPTSKEITKWISKNAILSI